MKKGKATREAIPRECGEAVSFTECTGLMPALPENEAQDDAMASLYAVHPAKDPLDDKPTHR